MALPAVAELFKTSFEDPLKKLLQPAGIIPALVLVGLNLVAIYPTLVDEKVAFATTLRDLDAAWQLGITAITVVVLGYVILAFSGSVLSMATGEGWRSSLLRPLLLWRQKRRRDGIRRRPAAVGPENRARDYELKTRFPRIDELAPTSLGNALSAIGDGVFNSYGADLTATWTQMRQAVRKENADFLAEIDDDQVGFLSLLNVAAVLVIFSVEGLVLALVLETGSFWLAAVVSLLAAYVAYQGAVARVASWGDHVAAAYDLYRPKFRELLGIGKPLTSAYEQRQLRAVSSALLWEDQDRWYTIDESPTVSLVSSPSVTAALLSTEASRPVRTQGPKSSAVMWVFDYLVSVDATDKDASSAGGVIEVIDRRLPMRIGAAPSTPSGTAPHAVPTIRRRSDIGLRDSIAWTITGLEGGKPFVLGYRLEWLVSVNVETSESELKGVSIVDGATDLRGLVRLVVRLEVAGGGKATLRLRDDRVSGQPALTCRDVVGTVARPLKATAADGHWSIFGEIPAGVSTLEVRRDDG